MKDFFCMGNKNIKAQGKVVVEYTDGITGKIKERIEQHNHTFEGSFMRSNLFWLNSSYDSSGTDFSIKLSDWKNEIDMDIPLVQGNIIGYASVGSSASGTKRGAENIAARSLGVYSSGKWHSKRQWSWLPSQVSSEIGSFGIGPLSRKMSLAINDSAVQKNVSVLQPIYNYPRPHNTGVQNYNLGKTYTASSVYIYNGAVSGTLDVYDNKDGAYKSVAASSIIPVPTDVYSSRQPITTGTSVLAVDVATNDVLVLMFYKNSSATWSVQLTRMNSDLTELKSRTIYSCGTYSNDSSVYPFTGQSASIYEQYGLYNNGRFLFMYAEVPSRKAKLCKLNTALWSPDGAFADALSFSDCLVASDDYTPYFYQSPLVMFTDAGFTFLTNGGTTSMETSFSYNMATVVDTNGKVLSSERFPGSTSSGYYSRPPLLMELNGMNMLLSHSFLGNYENSSVPYPDGIYNAWLNVGDLTVYKMPSDAPVRQSGQGITITYEIAWGYE